MSEITRGASYCDQRHCGLYAELRLVDPYVGELTCLRCGEAMRVEPEYGIAVGAGSLFSEVRVYYRFDPREKSYPEVVVSRDPSVMVGNSAYTFFSPIIRSRARAETTAEGLLYKLNRSGNARPPGRGELRADLVRQGWSVVA